MPSTKNNTMQSGRLNKKTIEDEYGEWKYEYYGTWGYPEIVSIKKSKEKFFSVDNPHILENY